MLKLFDSCAKNKQLFFSRSFSLRSNVSLQFGSNSFYPKFLNETRPRKPARRRSLPLATQQKSFLRISDFARAVFFLLKGKENFFAGFCSQRAGRRAWPLFFARTRRNSPHTPLPPFPCSDGRNFWRRQISFPCPTTRARKSLRNSLYLQFVIFGVALK